MTTPSDQRWKEVGERFANLGRHLKTHYDQQSRTDEKAPSDRRAVEDALRTLADALDDVMTSTGKAIRDPAVAEEARQATRSLGGALSASLAEFSQALRDRFKATEGRSSAERGPGDAIGAPDTGTTRGTGTTGTAGAGTDQDAPPEPGP